MFTNKTLITIGIILLVAVIATYIKLPLPDGVNEQNTLLANIESCDIRSHGDGRYGKSFLFVGISLSIENAPYLRWEAEKSNRKTIETMCKEKQLVEIRYKAQRLLIRPKVTYWVESLKIGKT